MAGYRGAAGKGVKTIDGRKYTLWGWLTSGDKRKGKVVEELRGKYMSVRVLGDSAPFAVWVW